MVEKRVYKVASMMPESEYQVEVLDEEFVPVQDTGFTVSVDGGDKNAVRSDGSGVIHVKIKRPATDVRIAFT